MNEAKELFLKYSVSYFQMDRDAQFCINEIIIIGYRKEVIKSIIQQPPRFEVQHSIP